MEAVDEISPIPGLIAQSDGILKARKSKLNSDIVDLKKYDRIRAEWEKKLNDIGLQQARIKKQIQSGLALHRAGKGTNIVTGPGMPTIPADLKDKAVKIKK